MKRSFLFALVIAILIVIAWAPALFAGVVMNETSIASGPTGETSAQNRIVYVQGDKQKVERQGVDAITDLDNRVIYIIDKRRRTYVEVPLQALSAPGPGESPAETIQLNKTGQTRIVANRTCSEYRAIKGNKLERVTISACVSTSAPGAKEVAAFEQKMVERLDRGSSDHSTGHDDAGLMLEKQSVVTFRVPDLSRKAYRNASLQTKTQVNQIQLKPLPADTFKPPRGFSKLEQPRPHRTVPPTSPHKPGHTIDVIAPNLSGLAVQASRL
jgi:hypothetical protein